MRQEREELLKKAIQFLENERELYGTFSPPGAGTRSTPEPLAARLAACPTLEELQELCTAAVGFTSDSRQPGEQILFGSGRTTANLMLIGNAPVVEPDGALALFSHEATELLEKILAAIHFSPQEVYITHLMKSPGGDHPLPEQQRMNLLFLKRQIELVDPGLILCLGQQPAAALLGTDAPIGELRGRIHPLNRHEVVVTYHPEELLNHPAWKRPTWDDVQLLRQRYEERYP